MHEGNRMPLVLYCVPDAANPRPLKVTRAIVICASAAPSGWKAMVPSKTKGSSAARFFPLPSDIGYLTRLRQYNTCGKLPNPCILMDEWTVSIIIVEVQ